MIKMQVLLTIFLLVERYVSDKDYPCDPNVWTWNVRLEKEETSPELCWESVQARQHSGNNQ